MAKRRSRSFPSLENSNRELEVGYYKLILRPGERSCSALFSLLEERPGANRPNDLTYASAGTLHKYHLDLGAELWY